jgi:hypothetical protein
MPDGLSFLRPGILEIANDLKWRKFGDFVDLAFKIPPHIANQRYASRNPTLAKTNSAQCVDKGRDYLVNKYLNDMVRSKRLERRGESGSYEYKLYEQLPPPVEVTSSEDAVPQPAEQPLKKRGRRSNHQRSLTQSKIVHEQLMGFLDGLRGSKLSLVLHITQDSKVFLEVEPWHLRSSVTPQQVQK